MVDFTYDSLAEDIGTGTADGLRNLANTAANVYCDAYAAYAGAFAPGSSPIGLVRGIDAFNSRLCSPRNKRPALPPSVPFSGGQCPIRYTVQGTVTQPTTGTTPYSVFNVLGPISGIVIGLNQSGQRTYFIQAAPDPPARPDGRIGLLSLGTNVNPDDFSATITSVTPPSGVPDTCGNPNPQYRPVIAPEVNLNVPVSVNLGGFTLNATAVIIPTKFEANLEVNAGVEVQIGDFNIQFDAGGVTINNEFKPSIDINLPGSGTDGRNNPPPAQPIERSDECPDIDQITTDLEEVIELLEDIKECACEDTEEIQVVLGVANSGILTSPSLDIVSVRLILEEIPETIRTQSGGANAPDVYYAGWCSFGTGGGNFGDRIPVSYIGNSYIAPEGARQFSFTLQQGVTALPIMIYKRPKQP